MNSPIHAILTEIRNRYTFEEVSFLDIRKIESIYQICSIVNTRSDKCAYLRITFYGLDENVVFEDIVFDFSLIEKQINIDNFYFIINKILYKEAYGVELKDSNNCILKKKIEKSSLGFLKVKTRNKQAGIIEKNNENEKKEDKRITIFDYIE